MQKLLDLVERHLGAGWLDVVRFLRDQNSLDDVEARVRVNDYEGAIAGIEEAAAKFAIDTHAGYVEAGQQAAAWLDGEIDSLVRFDVANDHAVRWAQQNELATVRQITEDQRQTMRTVIVDGVRDGRNPLEIARDLRDSIGLTDYQAQIVQNYRSALESGDWSDALGRELTDGRSDRSVEAARRAGKQLRADQIDTMVERYRQNMVGMRAEMLARTEALRVVHQGTDEMFRQAIARGDVDADSLVGQWMPGPNGKNARDWHREPALLAQRPKVGMPFRLSDGSEMEYPGDPAGGAENCIGCRCTRAVRLAA